MLPVGFGCVLARDGCVYPSGGVVGTLGLWSGTDVGVRGGVVGGEVLVVGGDVDGVLQVVRICADRRRVCVIYSFFMHMDEGADRSRVHVLGGEEEAGGGEEEGAVDDVGEDV